MVQISDYIRGFKDCDYELSGTVAPQTIMDLFVNRTDCYMEQSGAGWTRKLYPITLDLIQRHLDGQITMGVYQIHPTFDTVKWACFDIDNHDGTRDTAKEVSTIKNILEKENIPYYIEESGSPDSYHIWLFFVPTSTSLINNFMNLIKQESELDIEVFPKQRTISPNQFGNQVKVPLGINRKTNIRSKFVGETTVNRLIMIRFVKPEVRRPILPQIKIDTDRGNQMYPCQIAWLEDKTSLKGGMGHHARLSIAANALKSGYSMDEIISMFAHQSDFSPDITTSNILYIRKKGYYCSCRWIENHCYNLLDRDLCRRCKADGNNHK